MSKGQYAKYIVKYADDGSQVEDFCFVLRPDRDYAARRALRIYAMCTLDFKVARDLNDYLDQLERNAGVIEDTSGREQ